MQLVMPFISNTFQLLKRHYSSLTTTKHEEPYDPTDRREKKKQISNLLKLALKTKNYNDYPYVTAAPPATPASSLVSEATSASPLGQSGYSGLLASSAAYPNGQQKAENVWRHIYDFFEHYSDRTSDDELIDKRLSEARASIPTTINQILNSNFYGSFEREPDQSQISPLL